MEDMKDLKVIVDGREEKVRLGCTFQELAKKDQHFYGEDILLAKVGNKLFELPRKIPGDCNIEFLTGLDTNGRLT